MGESPAKAAVREAREEIGAEVRLLGLVDVLGGPDYEVTYPNGDRAAYVTAVYEAEIISGAAAVADGELSDVAWFGPAELAHLTLSRLSRALLTAIGRI
jgi:8-oxo-dGTP pyrophosphatase MutT (NUDIX family)